jgi:hypothetical protein
VILLYGLITFVLTAVLSWAIGGHGILKTSLIAATMVVFVLAMQKRKGAGRGGN